MSGGDMDGIWQLGDYFIGCDALPDSIDLLLREAVIALVAATRS
jgi:hypothetical protein